MSQKILPFGKPIIGEEEKNAVWKVMESGVMAHGQNIENFESLFAEFTGAPHSVALSSCTAALHLAYFHFEIGQGDEVIVPAQTHTATAHAVELSGAKPVFVDAEALTGNIDIAAIEAKINSNTKAISVVHFLGMPVNMHEVMSLAKKHQLKVVEDCALAVGSTLNGTHAGLFGDVGCFSFYPVKHFTTAEGGMLITRDEDIARGIRNKRAFGMDKHVGQRKTPGLYDVQGLGFNYRMNEIEAAIGIEQMKRLPGFLVQRKKNYEALTEALLEITSVQLLKSSHDEYQSSYYCHSVLLEDSLAEKRPKIIASMKEQGVGTSIYYPSPVPLMSYYKNKYGYTERDFPVAFRISNNSIALPVGPHLQEADMETVAKTLANAIKASAG